MDIVKEAKNLALREIEKFGIPSKIHFEISEKKALELAKKLCADKTITLLGVYLMDLKFGEAFLKGKIEEHVKMSIKATKEFLEKFDLKEEVKKKIINCVAAHHGQVPFICKEAEICANADCYRFLHPKGFFHTLFELAKMGMEFDEILNTLEAKLDEKHKILSLGICKKELEKYYYQFKELIKIAREL
jgi:hypothetical protein